MRASLSGSSRGSSSSSSGEHSSQEESSSSEDGGASHGVRNPASPLQPAAGVVQTTTTLSGVIWASSGTAAASTPARASTGEASGYTTVSTGSLIRACFSLEPEADLRAVPVRTLLAGFGHVWSPSSPPAARRVPTASRGKQQWFSTPKYDAFVSHHWGAGRLEKHLALLLAFNGRAALVIGITVGPLMGFLEVFFNFPEVTDWVDEMKVKGHSDFTTFRWWAELVGFVVFMSVIWCGHLAEGVCWRRRALFLDKLSIDQEDVQMKEAGIRSLPAYLNFSHTLLILWSDEYLSRLWCVLELATWVHLKKTNTFVLPVMTSEILCGYFFSMQLTGLMNSISQYHGVARSWIYLSLGPIFVVCVIAQALLQRRMRSRLALDKQLKSFDCRKAQCTEEKDRQMILDQIHHWFAQTATTAANTQSNADEAEAAHMRFNQVVRTKVLRQFHRVSGNATHLPYDWVLLACLPHWWRWCDITASAAEGSGPVDNVINIALHGVCVTFCYSPLLLKVFLGLSAWTAKWNLSCFVWGACISMVSLVVCALVFAAEMLSKFILNVDSWFITIAADTILLLITVVMYSSRMRWRMWSWLSGCRCAADDFVG